MRKGTLFLIAVSAIVLTAPAAFAAEGGSDSGALTYMALGCVIGLGLAALGGGIGMGNAISGALSAMARNPGFYQRLFPNMLIGLALIESLVIYTLVIVLILLYANPL
jgi:F-type H+-transporting ATPase subunit c